MPIDHLIDHERRLVLARGHGAFSDADVFAYQRDVWSRSDVAGYSELIFPAQWDPKLGIHVT